MGYVDPQQNIRGYIDVMNKKTQEVGDNFNLMFNELNQTMRSNIARNAARMQQEKLKKEIGLEAYLDLVKTTGDALEGGWKDYNDKWLRGLGDEYYELVGKSDTDSIMLRKKYEDIPTILARLQGTYLTLRENFDKSIAITGGYAGGFNPYTDPGTVGFITDNNNLQYDTDEKGNLFVEYDYDGEHYRKSAQELIDMTLEGGVGILTYGNPFEERQAIHDAIWKDNKFETAMLTLTQTSGADPNDKETWYLYDPINQQYKDAVNNENLYLGGNKSVLDNASLMRDYWPVIINDAYDEYKKGNGDQYKDLLEAILPESVLGADKLLGTADDGGMIEIPKPGEGNIIDKSTDAYSDWMQFYTVQGEAGVWDLANDNQRNLALRWFGSVDPDDTHIKENRQAALDKGAYTKQNLQNYKLRQSISQGNASTVETDRYRNEIRTWLKNSHDLQSRAFGDAPRLWGNTTDIQEKQNLLPQMDKWLNSPKGLAALGFNPPKGGKFTINLEGEVIVDYGPKTNSDGDPVDNTQKTGIILRPGQPFATDLNIRKILNAATKQYRADSQQAEGGTTDDPDGLFQN